MKGIFQMTTHRRILHDVIPARTIPVEGLPGALRTDPLARAARGILILSLVLGSLGADAAASSAHGSADHASTRQPAGNIRLTASSGHIAGKPWMY